MIISHNQAEQNRAELCHGSELVGFCCCSFWFWTCRVTGGSGPFRLICWQQLQPLISLKGPSKNLRLHCGSLGQNQNQNQEEALHVHPPCLINPHPVKTTNDGHLMNGLVSVLVLIQLITIFS